MKKFVFLFLVVAIGLIGIDYISFTGDVNAKSRVKPITVDCELKSIMLSDTLKDVQEEATEEADTTYLFLKEGTASWYGSNGVKGIKHTDGYHGRKTASGEIFNTWDMTCAYNDKAIWKDIRKGKTVWVRVTNVKNGKQVLLRVNDTGGFNKLGRIIDLSYKAMIELGTGDLGKVTVERVIIKEKNN